MLSVPLRCLEFIDALTLNVDINPVVYIRTVILKKVKPLALPGLSCLLLTMTFDSTLPDAGSSINVLNDDR